MRVIGKLWCWLTKHQRGKRLPDSVRDPDNTAYQCPRCEATWTRKKNVAKAPQPANRGETMHTLYEGKVAK